MQPLDGAFAAVALVLGEFDADAPERCERIATNTAKVERVVSLRSDDVD